MRKHPALMSALTASAALVAVVLPASAADQTVSADPDNRSRPRRSRSQLATRSPGIT